MIWSFVIAWQVSLSHTVAGISGNCVTEMEFLRAKRRIMQVSAR
jgi:hypothetical protein